MHALQKVCELGRSMHIHKGPIYIASVLGEQCNPNFLRNQGHHIAKTLGTLLLISE